MFEKILNKLKKNKKSQRQLVYEALLPYAQENLKKIEVIAGDYDGSQKCHHVARQILENNEAENVAVTLSFREKCGVNVHFINKVNGKYVDNTLGYLSKKNFYYLISEHNLEELRSNNTNMLKMLKRIKQDYLDKVFSKKDQKRLKITTSHL